MSACRLSPVGRVTHIHHGSKLYTKYVMCWKYHYRNFSALILLSKAGLITLKDNNDIAATVNDITANPKNLKFQELEAAQVPRSIDDVDLAVINSNFAMQVPLNPVKDSLYIEDATSPYVNIVAVRQGDEERPEIKALIKALQSEKVKKFIEEKYQGAVVATF